MSDFEGAKKLHFENEIVSPEELYRLRRENENLQLTRDKLVEKLDRKRKKLEDERANTAVFRQFFQEQKNKVEILERDKETLQVINPSRFDQGQNTEIETLKSEISSMNARLVHLEIAFKEIDRFQKLVPELKLELSGMENECNRLGTSTNDRDTLQQLLNDRTTENETLKTKIQDLSTTNEHYLSQLQRKDFTIETTTNKFDTEREQIQEQANQMETNLNEQLITTREEELDEKCVALKGDKCVLEIQVEVLREQFGELSEEKEQILEQANQMETNLNEQLITVKEELDEKCVALKDDKCVLEIQVEVLREQIGELSEEKEQILEQANQMETNLNEQLITTREEGLDKKCVALKGDKRVLETQVNVLRDQIGELSEEREKWQRHVNELEATVTGLQVQLPDFEEVQHNEAETIKKYEQQITETIKKYEQQITETIKKYEQQITELTNQITILTAVEENAAISQKLIGKLNQDIKMLETNNKQTQGQFQMELTESKRHREALERKLGEMARDLTDRDRKIRELTQPTAIQQNIGQVSKSPYTPVLYDPVDSQGETTKVILLWSKERPTLERELTYFDNSQDVVSLIWADEQSLYQGNGTLTVGKHHGSLMFPSSGDTVQVQPFEVSRKPMGMLRVKLKLNDPQAQENVKVEKLVTEGNSDQIEKMQAEIQELIVNNNNNIKNEKEKCKHELAKLDDQIIGLMTELSSIKVYGREEEQKLSQEVNQLKSELDTLRATSGHNLQSAGVSNEHVDVLEATLAKLQSKETENKMTIKEMRNEINSSDKENSDLKSEKMILEEKNIDLEESNVQYQRRIEELMQRQQQQQQQQPGGDANIYLTSQLETANQQILKNETEIGELNENLTLQQQKEETTSNELENMKTAFETEKQQIQEQAIQNETNLNEQLITARAELEEFYSQSRDSENTDQDILTKNEQLIQQVARLEEDNAKLQEEFTQKPSKQELIAQLDSTQSKVTELLRKNNSLQKTKNEIEDTLEGELNAARDEVFLLKTETNKQTETIGKQNETIETYKQQQQLFEEENKSFETKDKQISHLKMVNLELEASKLTCDTQIKELNEELQQNRSDCQDLDYVRKQSEVEYSEKCFALEDDKNVLEIQVDVLHVQIGELSEEREKWQRQVTELEATVTGLQVQLQKLGEAQQNETETIKKYEQQITELTNQITTLTALKENAAISQQLVGKLNQDIKMLETNNKQTQEQFQMELTESKRHREDLERKLEEMSRELTDRDRKIRELTQPTAIQQGMGQVSKSPSTPILGLNPKQEKAKSQGKGKDSKSKYPDPSTGATNMELTPQLVPQPNKTSKSPSKITFRGTSIPVVKLKAFPNMTECHSKQVICTINKHYELGQLMCIAELPTKVGLRNAVAKHAGIKLYSPVGNCDGAYKDLRYFDCPPNYGIFVPLEDVYVPVP